MRHLPHLLLAVLFISLLNGCGVTKNYEKAKSSQSVADYETYIAKYAKSKYIGQAKGELAVLYEARDWEAAQSSNSITGFETFLSTYPYSKHSTEAESKIAEIQEQVAWSTAKRINNVVGFEKYLNEYPTSAHSGEAQSRINNLKDEAAWNRAELLYTISGFENYLGSFPDGKYAKEAQEDIHEIRVVQPKWDKTHKENSPHSYRSFISQYPSSRYSDEARQKLSGLERNDWSHAKSEMSITLYQNFIEYFPNSSHTQEAEKAIIDLEVENIFKGDHGILPPMIKTFNGKSGRTYSEIDVFNNTEYTLTVRYSGETESKKVILPPYQRQTFNLNNESYKVAASVNAGNVTNYAGTDTMEGGDYESEFFIQTF